MTKPIIPDAALSQHIAVLGKTGSGKTFAAKASIVEPLLAAGKRVGVIDPTGAWFGLRSSRDGKGPGFPILVLGGDHGDLPLPALGGAAVARLLAEQGVNLVADTSQLTVGERTRWFIDFASTFYRLNRAPLHLVIDEAHNFAPQGKVPDPDTGKMLHAANTLASGGRSRGIRLVMITQRPQKLHKDALTSADTLIAMRVLAPHDRLAVEDWIKGCGDPAQGKEVLNSLASLKRGEGWVWYPEGAHLARVNFPEIRTFDSSATPTDGHAIKAPKAAADIDLTEIRAALADAVKEAEANDPKLLRAEIAKAVARGKELERQLAKAGGASPAELAAEYTRGREDGFDAALAGLSPFIDRTETLRAAIDEQLGGFVTDLRRRATMSVSAATKVVEKRDMPARQSAPQRAQAPRAAPRAAQGPGVALARAERRVLTALAQYPQGRSKSQVAILTGYAVNGGGFNNAIGAARSAGRVSGTGDQLRITEQGLADLGIYDPLPHGDALLQHWLGQLGKAERATLDALAQAYPGALSKEELAARAGYEASGGGFNNALGRLRSLELITGRGELTASEDLFG